MQLDVGEHGYCPTLVPLVVNEHHLGGIVPTIAVIEDGESLHFRSALSDASQEAFLVHWSDLKDTSLLLGQSLQFDEMDDSISYGRDDTRDILMFDNLNVV